MTRTPSTKRKARAAELPDVTVSDDGSVRHLHLGTPWIQGSMRIDEPYALELEYVQRMTAWLLFVEPQSVARRQAVQLGLGAGALTKHCWKVLKMARTTAVELNPQVIGACRWAFKLPADGPRLQVLLGDAAEAVRQPPWAGAVDVLHVDLYDQDAAAPVLDSPGFYADCRATLAEDGAMVVNLFGRDASYPRSLAHIQAAFGAAGAGAVWAFKPTREGNTVVVALRTAVSPADLPKGELARRAESIHTRWQLPAPKWLRSFKPVDVLPACY